MIYKEGTELVSSYEILTSTNIYKIPNYQRAYTWGKNSLDSFIDDIFTKGVVNDYYLGTLYVVKDANHDNVKYVIDGQQRITTLLLLINALRIKLGINIDKYLSRSENDAVLDTYEGTPQFYKLFSAVNEDEVSCLHSEIENQSLTTSQVIYNQLAILELLDRYEVSGIELDELLKHLLFVNIGVEKELFGYQIFENLNSKGITLSNVDIIKNGLFSRINDDDFVDPHNSTKYLKWKEIEDNMMQFSTVKLAELERVKKEFTNNLEDMIKFYTQCKTTRKSITKTNYGISKVYINYLEGDNVVPLSEISELANYSKYAKYVFYPQKNIHNYTIGRRINKYFRGIETLKVKQHRNMSISFIKLISENKCTNLENAIITFYKKLVIFHYLFNTISSEVPSKISGVYLDAAIKLYSKNISENKIKGVMDEVLESLEVNLPTKETIIQRIEKTVFYVKEKLVNKIKFDKKEYKVYEGKYYGDNLFEIIETSKRDNTREIEIQSIEHVLNQNIQIVNYENYKLYSMLPLEQEINSNMGVVVGMPISDKIPYLKDSDYYLVQEFVRFYENEYNENMSDIEFIKKWKGKFVDILYQVYMNL